jgi:hypothetical protein
MTRSSDGSPMHPTSHELPERGFCSLQKAFAAGSSSHARRSKGAVARYLEIANAAIATGDYDERIDVFTHGRQPRHGTVLHGRRRVTEFLVFMKPASNSK